MIDFSADTIVLKFTGDGISPGAVHLQEIADKVTAIERLLEPILSQDNKDVRWEKSFLGLEKLEQGSIILSYKLKQHKSILLTSLLTLATAIKDNNIDTLPGKTVHEIEKISRFNSKYNCQAELGVGKGVDTTTIASFGRQFSPDQIEKIKGYTTVYGWIRWLGGDADNPSIELVLNNGQRLTVEVNEEDLQKYRAHSYVGISGNAVWKGRELALYSLEAKEIFAYDKRPVNEAFDELREIFKDYPLNSLDNY
jgi:hypothetical protein